MTKLLPGQTRNDRIIQDRARAFDEYLIRTLVKR